MKFFVIFVAFVAVAMAGPISVGPAIIEQSPISVGPAFIDFPLPDGGEVSAVQPSPVALPSPIVPSPVVFGPLQPGQPTPLVQIIVNANQPQIVDIVDMFPVVDHVIPEPVQDVEAIIPEPVIIGTPVLPEPVQVVETVIPEPVIIGTPVLPEPVQVVEPVIVGTPIIPAPAIALSDALY